MRTRSLMLTISLSLLLMGCSKKEVVVIGVGPLTGEGAVYGKPQIEAAAMAIEEINRAGGLLGQQIKFIPYDDKKDPKEAVSIAQQVVINSNVIAVIGHPNSGAAMAASKVYNQHRYPFIVSSATNPQITDQGFDNVFRFAPTDAMQGKSIALFVKNTLARNSLWIIYSNMEYGKGLAESVRENFLAQGGIVKYFDSTEPNATDYRPAIAKLKSTNPEIIVFPAMLPEAAKFIRQLKEQNVKATVILGDGAFDENLKSLSGSDCSKVILSFLVPPWETIPTAKTFVEKFTQKYGSLPPFAPYGYETIEVLATAVTKANSFDRDKIITALHSSDFTVKGITGTITFDQKGQARDRLFSFYKFSANGKLIAY